MPSANGDGPKFTPRAILYARVSTEEQARSGYSLAQQLEALRQHAAREGFEVLEEVSDPGQSGASLERPGMDRVRNLVAAGGVVVVLAQDRDRFAREPAYHYLLKREFEEQGTKIRSLNDRGDDSPEGELTDGILDQLSKFERAKIAERTRRGKRRKVSEGKVIPSKKPKYGFRLNAARDGYEVDPERMALVRRVFEMAASGESLKGMAATLDREGVPTPGGGRHWDRTVLKAWLLDDAYKPHTPEEVREIVSPEAAADLQDDSLYGVLWWGRRAATTKQVSEATPEGRKYRKTYSYRQTDRDEQTAVPLPDSRIPRELVEAARRQVEGNKRPSSAGEREWELSGGIALCGECGRRLRARRKSRKKNGREYVYMQYRCPANEARGREECENATRLYAGPLEEKVWGEIRAYLSEPERLRADLERMIELKRDEERTDPDAEIRRWHEALTDAERKRAAYQDQQAEGLITMPELKEKLAALEERREVARRELAALEGRRDEIARMEGEMEAVLEYYEALAPDALDSLEPVERRQLYGMLGVQVFVDKERGVRIETPLLVEDDSASAESIPRFARTAAQ